MISLDHKIIKDRYDVIVVGAGIGGITAGALLSHKGLSVLVVEQHYIPGGVCSSIKRHDTAMDAGAALLFGWGDSYSNPHNFVMNTLQEDIDIIPHKALYRMHFSGGRHVTFWKDFEKYFAELAKAFPGKEDQFRGFYEESFKVYKLMTANPMIYSPDTIPKSVGLKMLLKNPIKTLKMGKLMNQTLKKLLNKYVKDPEVEGLFDLLIASCYCTDLAETPLMLAAAVLCNTHVDGAFYPAGSPQMLPNKLEKGLEKNGGDILYRAMVDEILIKDNEAYGIKLSDGTKIYADHIVSNATIWNLYGKLIKPEHISPERMEWAQKFEPTVAAAIAYITVKKEAIPEGTTSIEAFINDLTNMDENNYFVYIPSVDDPSICPPDMHSISILCAKGDYDWPRPWDPSYQGEEYVWEKEKILEKALSAIEPRFPKFRENIVSVDMASPTTTERFTLRNYGCIGGPKQAMGQHLLNRLKARTEFKNLYAVGDSTVMGEGVISVTTSAIGAANMVLEDRKMPIFLLEEPERSYVHYVEGKPRAPLPNTEDPITEKTSQRIAVECQWCEDPKCMNKCPAGIDVLNFIRRIEGGNIVGAAKSIRENNPLGGICGILCPSEKLCESVCNRLDFSDHPVRIKDLHHWACKTAGEDGWDRNESLSKNKNIAIVGAGPFGLSCAYFLAKFGFGVELYEKTKQIGGIINQAIPQHRITDEYIQTELNSIVDNERIHVHYEQSLGENLKLDELSANHHAVILATGLSQGKILNIPGLESVNHRDALSFLRKCRTNSEIGELNNILVVGGGSVAVDAAISAAKQGAKSVKMVCLESEGEMLCLDHELEELDEYNIEVLNSWGPVGINYQENSRSLTCSKCTSVCDDEGNFSPTMDESSKTEISFDEIIFAVGQQMDPSLISYLETQIPDGLINKRIGTDSESNVIRGYENLYIGGDLYHGGSTIVQAVSDGRKIASEILKSMK